MAIGSGDQKSGNGRTILRRVGLIGFAVCSTVFLGDVFIGKAEILFGFHTAFRIGIVAEFLVLFAAAAFFVVAALASEQMRDAGPKDQPTQGRTE